MTDKIKVKLFIHKDAFEDGKYEVSSYDGTPHGNVLLGTQWVEVDVPTKDPVLAELEMLANKLAVVEQESFNKISKLKQRIASLQAIEHKG